MLETQAGPLPHPAEVNFLMNSTHPSEVDYFQHKFLSGYKTSMETVLHKLKQRVEKKDAK